MEEPRDSDDESGEHGWAPDDFPEVELDWDTANALVPGGVHALIHGRAPVPPDRRRQACIHEAGHAVMATVLAGTEVRDVEVFRVGGGRCMSRWSSADENILVTLGGLGAELLFTDEEYAPFLLRGACRDIEDARVAIGYPERDVDGLDWEGLERVGWCLDSLARFMSDTKLVLAYMSAAVLAVAAELHGRGYLEGYQVSRIVEAHKPAGPLDGDARIRAFVLAEFGGEAAPVGKVAA